MYCPNCGTQALSDQKFCRGCGVSLGQVYQMRPDESLNGPAEVANRSDIRGSVVDDRQKYRRFGFILFWSGIMLAALLGILGDATRSLSWRLGHFIENLAGLGGLVVLAGIGLMIFSRFFASVRAGEPARQRSIQPPTGIAGHPGHQPETSFESRGSGSAPSVTEHTTYTLDQRVPGPTPRRN